MVTILVFIVVNELLNALAMYGVANDHSLYRVISLYDCHNGLPCCTAVCYAIQLIVYKELLLPAIVHHFLSVV